MTSSTGTSQREGQKGPIRVTGPNEVSISHAAAIHPLMGTSGLCKGPREYSPVPFLPIDSAG